MDSFDAPRKRGRGALIVSCILAVIFTVAIVFSTSIFVEMFQLAITEEKDLGEGLGLAFLLIIQIVAMAVLVVLSLIGIVPFAMALKSERGLARSVSVCVFIYQAVATVLSILTFIALILVI